jgi:argininosuccinate synthase
MASVVLAYSGGLDTSICVHWLRHEKGMKVITFSADLGQGNYFEPVAERALAIGAESAHISDLREEFLTGYVFKALKAHAVYGNGYLLATALGRPLIAKGLVDLARENGCDYVSHGCTGKGNDQIRIEASVSALAPELKIIAPLREWDLKTREEEMEYAERHNIPVEVTKKHPYSLDRNLWGMSIECGVLEDPWEAPPKDTHILTTPIEESSNEPVELTLDFEGGLPVALDGEAMEPVKLVKILDKMGGKQTIGRIDVVEDRTVGIKSRELYEAPAATILYAAHGALECLCLSKDILTFKRALSDKYADLVYTGHWFTELRGALDAFFDSYQKYITGSVRLRLFKGHCTVTGVKSPYSMYEHDLATYGEKDVFDHKSAEGFMKLWNLPMITEARRHGMDDLSDYPSSERGAY